MKQFLFTVIIILTSTFLWAQNPQGFDAMCNGYIEGTVPLATPKQVHRMMNNTAIIILDARETKEYNTSHIKGAIKVGYDHFNMASVQNLDHTLPVYVYCSIGYRSEKVGEQLQKAGFKKVYNVYGGIFNWANSGYTLVDENGKATTKVHGYNNDWSQWLNTEKCTKVID
ncbi:MAG: rhodanese-like domain-containing protein [Flavobacteriales bacterium]|jgi:rhodanese-related sulfurtransferase|nr:rhodanese-like domain-containing protein [Flavobacteriales bacterium]